MDKMQSYIDRFRQDPKSISDEELAAQYGAVTRQLPQQDYQQVAQQALAQLNPQERLQLGRELMAQAQQQGVPFPDVNRDGIDDRLQDPATLASYTAQMQQSQPNFFSQILGGGGGGSMMKMALGGIAALGLGRMLGGGGHHNEQHGMFGGGLFGGHGGGLFGGGGGHHGGGHH